MAIPRMSTFLLVVMCGSVLGDSRNLLQDIKSPLDVIDSRNPRYFLPQFITIRNIECAQTVSTGTLLTGGECLTKKDCTQRGGKGTKPCLLGLGVCCQDDKASGTAANAVTCAGTARGTVSSFTNPSYPSKYKASGSCQVNVELESNTCQLLLNYTDFDLAQPDTNGVCKEDYFKVSGTLNDASYPKLCGDNDGQHMYIDVDPASNPKITVFSEDEDVERSWNVSITQIPCDANNRAPPGCLQYYNEPVGDLKSFNYKSGITTIAQANQHLANLDYGICIDPDEYCSIRFKKDEEEGLFAFMMSGDPVVEGINTGPTVDVWQDTSVRGGGNCTTDYVVIPQGMFTNPSPVQNVIVPTDQDRYCGLSFPTEVTSTGSPFVMYVNTNDNEAGDSSNVGFHLQYSLVDECTS